MVVSSLGPTVGNLDASMEVCGHLHTLLLPRSLLTMSQLLGCFQVRSVLDRDIARQLELGNLVLLTNLGEHRQTNMPLKFKNMGSK